jgi:hypothetical protein
MLRRLKGTLVASPSDDGDFNRRTFIGAALTKVEVDDIPSAFNAKRHQALWVELRRRG